MFVFEKYFHTLKTENEKIVKVIVKRKDKTRKYK
jgi:hypothetical protein